MSLKVTPGVPGSFSKPELVAVLQILVGWSFTCPFCSCISPSSGPRETSRPPAAYGQLGETRPARSAVSDLLALQPDYASIARLELGKLFDAELVEHLVDGLRKAGLEITEAAPAKGAASRRERPQ